MAGIVAAATDNGKGIAGVGYAGVKVMPVTVLGADGTGQDSDVIAGVVWAVDHDADVILMSFSNPGFSPSLQDAIDYAWDNNVVVVAATGNDGSSTPTFPAGDRGVVGVSNTDMTDSLDAVEQLRRRHVPRRAGHGHPHDDRGRRVRQRHGHVGRRGDRRRRRGPHARDLALGASNGVIVSRLAKNADAAGTTAQTGNGRLNLERSVQDTSSDSVEPAGAAPVGGGGPFVGPVCRGGETLNGDLQGQSNPACVTPCAVSVADEQLTGWAELQSPPLSARLRGGAGGEHVQHLHDQHRPRGERHGGAGEPHELRYVEQRHDRRRHPRRHHLFDHQRR